jgi:hypothetical protein
MQTIVEQNQNRKDYDERKRSVLELLERAKAYYAEDENDKLVEAF